MTSSRLELDVTPFQCYYKRIRLYLYFSKTKVLGYFIVKLLTSLFLSLLRKCSATWTGSIFASNLRLYASKCSMSSFSSEIQIKRKTNYCRYKGCPTIHIEDWKELLVFLLIGAPMEAGIYPIWFFLERYNLLYEEFLVQIR